MRWSRASSRTVCSWREILTNCIEGMIITAHAIGANTGYVFLRWAYKKAARRIEKAIFEAREGGYLGEHILGTDFNMEIYLHTSAGRYICGEATALLNSLEGRRANPRAKPPHTAAVGLWGRPTDVNNVETLSNVPHILKKRRRLVQGPEPYRRGGYQNLRGQRSGQAARMVGTPHGYHRP